MNGEIPELFKRTSVGLGSSPLLQAFDCSSLVMLALVAVTFFVLTRNKNKIKRSVKKIKKKIETEGFQTLLPAPFKPAVKEVVAGEEVAPGLDLCHPECCHDTQWPVPLEARSSTEGSTILQQYNKTSLHCRGCNGVGCLCSKKTDL